MIDLDTIEDVVTIINRYNDMLDSDKIENKVKDSKSINFLMEIMKNKVTNI